MFFLSLETFNYLTLWISSAVPPVLTFSSKLRRPRRQKISIRTNGSSIQKDWKTKSFLPMTHSLAFCATATTWKRLKRFQNLVNSGLTSEQAVAKLRKDRKLPTGAEKCSYLESIWEINTMQHFSDFLNTITMKMLLRHWWQCRKWLSFTTTRELIW